MSRNILHLLHFLLNPRDLRPHTEIRRVQCGPAGRILRTSPCQRAGNHELYRLRMSYHPHRHLRHKWRLRLPQKPHSPSESAKLLMALLSKVLLRYF